MAAVLNSRDTFAKGKGLQKDSPIPPHPAASINQQNFEVTLTNL